ncbi:YpmA family protein [Ferroacidibacillus organovorans]|uniref:YpmA family protein n=1 Tax=Ferroacidibacillus organovorans TaxID=1765683 RepID=UPI0009E94090|nr:YpmA family protein [Ferroacidibacillus organovorans]
MERADMILATKDVAISDDLYQLIDFLNRTLKDLDVIFGLSKSKVEEGKYTVTIYRAHE